MFFQEKKQEEGAGRGPGAHPNPLRLHERLTTKQKQWYNGILTAVVVNSMS